MNTAFLAFSRTLKMYLIAITGRQLPQSLQLEQLNRLYMPNDGVPYYGHPSKGRFPARKLRKARQNRHGNGQHRLSKFNCLCPKEKRLVEFLRVIPGTKHNDRLGLIRTPANVLTFWPVTKSTNFFGSTCQFRLMNGRRGHAQHKKLPSQVFQAHHKFFKWALGWPFSSLLSTGYVYQPSIFPVTKHFYLPLWYFYSLWKWRRLHGAIATRFESTAQRWCYSSALRKFVWVNKLHYITRIVRLEGLRPSKKTINKVSKDMDPYQKLNFILSRIISTLLSDSYPFFQRYGTSKQQIVQVPTHNVSTSLADSKKAVQSSKTLPFYNPALG